MGVKQGRGGVNKPFYSFKRQYLANGRRYVQTAKLLLMSMHALLTDTKTDDLELHKVRIFGEFHTISQISDAKMAITMKIGPCQRSH